MPDELKRDLLLIASKLRPIARNLVQAADQLHEQAPQIQAQIKPTAEKLGSQLEAGAQQVGSALWHASVELPSGWATSPLQVAEHRSVGCQV